MADSNFNPGSPLEANRVCCDPESHAGMDSVAVGYLHSISEFETMQERRDGTEAKLCNLINQLEELLLLLQEA